MRDRRSALAERLLVHFELKLDKVPSVLNGVGVVEVVVVGHVVHGGGMKLVEDGLTDTRCGQRAICKVPERQ